MMQLRVTTKGKSKFIFLFLVISVSIGTAAIAYALFHGMVFETNDDREFSSILAGSFGVENSPYTYFLNYVLSCLISTAFQVLGTSINWYVAICLTLSCAGLGLICSIITKCQGAHWRYVLLSLAVVLLTFGDQFAVFQFTKNAGFYAAVGWFGFIASTVLPRCRSKIIAPLSALLLWSGFMVRAKAALMTSAFFIVVLLIMLTLHTVKRSKENRSITERVIDVLQKTLSQGCWGACFFGVTVICVLACMYVHSAVYSTPEWRMYEKQNDINFHLLAEDLLPEYSDHGVFYQGIDISENDYTLYQDWSGGDQSIFSEKKLHKMLERGTSESSFDVFSIISSFIQGIKAEQNGVLLLVGALAVTLYSTMMTRGARRVMPFALLLLLIAELLYLSAAGRIVHRVFYCAYIGYVLSGILFMLWVKEDVNGVTGDIVKTNLAKLINATDCVVLIMAVAISGANLVDRVASNPAVWKRDPSYFALLEIVRDTKQKFFLFDRPTISNLATKGMNPLRTTGVDDYENMAYLGGWIALTPVNQSALKEKGLDSGYEALGKLENALLVDHRHPDEIEQFVREHYAPNASMREIESVGNVQIYEFVHTGTNRRK